MLVNSLGHERFTEAIYSRRDFKDGREVAEALLLLAEHLKVEFVRTNATKHGGTELQIKTVEG